MARAFIIRPFGVKEGVNFDAVDERLIQPALAQIGVSGNTTTEIVEQGNIREDMAISRMFRTRSRRCSTC